MITYTQAQERLKELLTEDFLAVLTEVAQLDSWGDWGEIATMVRECHRIAGSNKCPKLEYPSIDWNK